MAEGGLTAAAKPAPEQPPVEGPLILAGDIGGTNARLALYRCTVKGGPDGIRQVVSKKYPSKERSGLIEILREFLGTEGHGATIAGAAFGIAGPVHNGRCETTNLPWVIDEHDLARDLGLPQGAVTLINDLEANAHGIGGLKPEDFAVLQQGAATASGNQAVISAGTGLGQAGIVRMFGRSMPFASEGGHATFAPRDELEIELLRWLLRKHEHVSGEHVTSGPGLVNLYEFLRETRRGEEPAWLRDQLAADDHRPAVITRAALEKHEPLASAALDLFVSIYGHEASNVAMRFMATGGVFLGGGIAPKIAERLRGPGFLESFRGVGRLRALLEAIPVLIILNDGAALLGAARVAAATATALKHS